MQKKSTSSKIFTGMSVSCIAVQELSLLISQWLRHWIPNPGVPGFKMLGGSEVNSAFHPMKLIK